MDFPKFKPVHSLTFLCNGNEEEKNCWFRSQDLGKNAEELLAMEKKNVNAKTAIPYNDYLIENNVQPSGIKLVA